MQTRYQTPLVFLFSTILTHPLYLLSARVHFHKFSGSEEYEIKNSNSWRAAKNILANHGGIRGLYQGFVPNAIIQTLLFLPFLFFSKHRINYQPGEIVVIEESIVETNKNE
jgi:ABC-type microcin C transport system permease subunit YejE